MQNNKPKIIACIPAYNEEAHISKVISLCKKYVDKVVVCDDGSKDLTPFFLDEALDAEILRHKKNMGKGVALRTMLKHVKKFDPDIVVTLDSDGQHDPRQIPALIKPIIDGEAEAVIGSRYSKGSWTDAPFYRKIGLKLVNFTCNGGGKNRVEDTQSGFRAFSRQALDVLQECEADGYGIETEQISLLKKKGLKIVEVPITIRYKNLASTSKKDPLMHGIELIGIALRLIVEEKPLILLGIPAILLILLGISTGVDLLLVFNSTRYFSMPLALITLGAFFLGAMFFITSLILYAISRLKHKVSDV